MSGREQDGGDFSTGREAVAEVLGSRYQVRDKLGAGAFGEVYRALDATLQREVAIKRIRLDAFAESGQLDQVKARFVREAQVAAQLRHPNIITTHDIVSTPEMSFIVMELVQGETLQALLKRNGRMTLTDTLRLFEQAAGALDHAHAHGVVHRDVKPANIMIEPSGNLKVMDFGIAKGATSADITASGAILGTPNYMSPEQARGEELDGRSDLFSLGCILYECLTGQKPFTGDNVTAVLMKILTSDPPAVDLERTGLPAAVNDVLRAALSKDRRGRFETGAALVEALRGLAYGAASVTVPPPVAEPASAEAPSGATLGTTPVVAPPPPVPRSPAWRRPLFAGAAALVLLAALVFASSGGGWRTLAYATEAEAEAAAADAGGRPVLEIEDLSLASRLLGRKPMVRITVAEQTPLALALSVPLTSASASPGDAFTATTAEAVLVEGYEAIPAGSVVEGHVAHAAPAGNVSGTGELTLEFDALLLGEERIPIRVEPLQRRAATSRRRDAKTVAGGAGAGAVVGGIFGGKKGALVGGLIGGAAGGARVATTRGQDVTFDEGAPLEIRIEDSLVLTRVYEEKREPEE